MNKRYRIKAVFLSLSRALLLYHDKDRLVAHCRTKADIYTHTQTHVSGNGKQMLRKVERSREMWKDMIKNNKVCRNKKKMQTLNCFK